LEQELADVKQSEQNFRQIAQAASTTISQLKYDELFAQVSEGEEQKEWGM
jgi:hypothetical protein